MTRTCIAAALLLTLGICARGVAQENPPTSAPSVLVSAGDKDAIQANMGKDVTVEGTVSDAQWIPSGAVFLMKFKDAEASNFQGVIFSRNNGKETMEKALGGDLSNVFEGSKIQIKGKLGTYRDHPQIIIANADQVTILS